MNQQTDPAEEWPCSRGCTWEPATEGEPPLPKPAKHGVLCNSCFYRLTAALKAIPDLMANMRAQIVPGGAQVYGERVSGSGDGTPVPLRIDPLDASDSLYAKLVSWTELLGGELHTPQPSVAVWINFREAQGSKPVSPSKAHELATQLVAWFTVRLDDIAATSVAVEFHDDLCYGWEDARGVFSLLAAYGVEPRPVKPSPDRECEVCGANEMFVKWPDKFDPELAVMCGRCKAVIDPERYKDHARLFG
jgi:hypothetical protein